MISYIIVIFVSLINQGTGAIKLFMLFIVLKVFIDFLYFLKVFINFCLIYLLDTVEGIVRNFFIRYHRYKKFLSNVLKYVFKKGFVFVVVKII